MREAHAERRLVASGMHGPLLIPASWPAWPSRISYSPACVANQQRKLLSVWKQFRAVLWRQGLCFCPKCRLCCLVEWWRGACPSWDGHGDLHKELLLAGRRAGAQQSCRLGGHVLELMRRVRWDVDGVAGSRHIFRSTERHFDFALKDGEGLFEVMTMRRRAAAGRDMHIDKTEAPRGVLAGEEDGIGIANYAEVGQVLVGVGLCAGESTAEVVRRNR